MSCLMIPMTVEAFAANELQTDLKKVMKVAPDYKRAGSVLGSQCTPGFSASDPALAPGIHLHFILPDSFTHSPNGTDYPEVPNRYVVTRVWWDKTQKKLLSKCGVVESDFTSQNSKYKGSIRIPQSSDPVNGMRFCYLGRSYPADKIPQRDNGDGYLDKLTAIGAGNPYFAAYYPECKSVFGFYDDLKDLTEESSVMLTYFVMGYFSKADQDPFSKVTTADDFAKALAERKLAVKDQSTLCDKCVFYGAIDAIEWKGFGGEYCPPPTGRVNIAFGNTSAEALSLAVKKALGDDFDMTERLLTALQYELYEKQPNSDGDFMIDDEILLQAFTRCDGQDENLYLSADKNVALKVSDDLGQAFSKLKTLGEEIGVLHRAIAYEKKKLFSVWELYVLLYEDDAVKQSERAAAPSKQSMLDEIQEIWRMIEGMSKSAESKTKEFDKDLKTFSASLPAGVTCKRSGSESFFTPKDPVLLLSGPGVKRTYAFGEDGRFTANGMLQCQTETVSAQIGKEELFKKCFGDLSYQDNLPVGYQDLLYQTALICSKTVDKIKSILGEIVISGEMPSEIAVNKDPFHWTTLYMFWALDYMPTRTVKNRDNTLADWNLVYGDTTLTYDHCKKPPLTNPQRIWGKSVLSPFAVKTLSRVMERYGDTYGKEEYKNYADKIKDFSIISQNLGGFSEYFSSFWNAWQLPIMGIGEDAPITKAVAENVGKERHSILNECDLLPMRGGYVQLQELYLVSSFGQRQVLVENSYYNQSELEFSETVRYEAGSRYGLLPPAFTVPAKLSVDYVSAMDKNVISSIAPESTPVCGIVVPELLNKRLLAYTPDGRYLGMVKTVYRNQKPLARWISAPELKDSFENLEINHYLKNFLRALVNFDHAFAEMNELMDKFLSGKQNNGTLIWGRPLVLARAKADFSLFGGPEFSKKAEDFRKYDTYGAEQICFQLGIGDMRRTKDGLLGCFNDNDFTKLFPPFGTEKPSGEKTYVQYEKTLQLSNADHARYFTFLLEPSAPVNIQTGILPVKTLYFEPAHSKVLDNLNLSAEVSPVLASLGQVGLPPLPLTEGETSYEWFVPDENGYLKNKIIPPLVSFDETVLMDGMIVKDGI